MNPRFQDQRNQRDGFALLITITLLAFLVLLLVSLASLTRVETQVASNSRQLAAARQNAMMALNIALGQLQQAAGPDQRVTARAEILDSDSVTLRNTVVRQPLWTGVWKTGNAGLDVNASGTPQRQTSLGSVTPTPAQKVSSATAWLVSTPTPGVANTLIDPTTYIGTTTGASRDAVALASDVGPDRNVTVTVPLIDLKATPPGFSTDQTVGRYAYWVSDEGVKAKVNYIEPNFSSTTLVQQQSRFLGAQAVAAHKVFPEGSFADLRPNAALRNVLSYNQLNFLSTATPSPADARYFPDVTTQGYGVLADVRNGGLKRDLTAAFEDATQFQQLLAYSRSVTGDAVDDEKLYRAPGVEDYKGFNFSGLRWVSLYNYYNLYKDAIPNPTPGGSASPFKGAFGNNQTPASTPVPSVEMRSYQLPGIDYGADALAPRLLGVAVYIGLSSEKKPEGYKLKLHYSPQIILYNPYNVTLTIPPTFTPEFAFTSNMLGLNWTVKVGEVEVITNKPILTNEKPADPNGKHPVSDVQMSTAATADVTFSPGQIRIYSIKVDDEDAKALSVMPAATNTLLHDGVAGASRCAYIFTDKPSDWQEWTGVTTTASENVQLTFPANFTVKSNNSIFRMKGLNAASKWPGTVGFNEALLSRLFPNETVGGSTSIDLGPIGNLTSPQYFLQLIVKVKGTTSPIAYPLFARSSPAHNPLSYIQNENSTDVVLKRAAGINPKTDPNGLQIDPSSVNNSFWGQSAAGTDPSDKTNVILIDIPRQPLYSLGQLQHVYPEYVANYNSVLGKLYGLKIFPQSSVGGSLPSAFLETTTSSVVIKNGKANDPNAPLVLSADDNFFSNEALFDSYFFSTVPHGFQASNKDSFAPINETFDDSYIASNKSLPNSKLRYHANPAPPTVTALRDLKKAASKLKVDGAFNVNSTSVNAWRALLSASSGSDFRSFDITGTETPLTKATLNNPFVRLATPVTATGSTVDTPWNGIRTLDDAAITRLATEIVKEVKNRGPFLTMADFVNRRLVANTDSKGLKGALQAAIDVSGINTNTLVSEGANSTLITNEYGYPGTGKPANLDTINTATGIPGWIMQQDILQALSPVLSVRSDCFTIRTYGEVVNPTTNETSNAYLEAVVQRAPEYMNPSDPAENTAAHPDNIKFGRRFKIVSLRWLTRNEL